MKIFYVMKGKPNKKKVVKKTTVKKLGREAMKKVKGGTYEVPPDI